MAAYSKHRGYAQKKLDENMDSEIMQVLLDEARNAYDDEMVIELKSNAVEDLDSNVERIGMWIEHWKKNNATD